jgi:hypothetical protein
MPPPEENEQPFPEFDELPSAEAWEELLEQEAGAQLACGVVAAEEQPHAPEHERKRARSACIQCHERKLRCTMRPHGGCERCERKGWACTRRVEKKRGRPRTVKPAEPVCFPFADGPPVVLVNEDQRVALARNYVAEKLRLGAVDDPATTGYVPVEPTSRGARAPMYRQMTTGGAPGRFVSAFPQQVFPQQVRRSGGEYIAL